MATNVVEPEIQKIVDETQSELMNYVENFEEENNGHRMAMLAIESTIQAANCALSQEIEGAAYHARIAISSAAAASQEVAGYSSLETDRDVGNWSVPLWNDTIPWKTEECWKGLQSDFQGRTARWRYWLTWYEGLLSGKPIPWEVQGKVTILLQDSGNGFGETEKAIEEALAAEDYNLVRALDEIRQRLKIGVEPSFGNSLERQERRSLRQELTELRTLLRQDTKEYGGIGHNQPPEEFELTVELKNEATEAVDQMEAELVKDVPDIGAFIKAAYALKKVVTVGIALVVGGFLAGARNHLYAKTADGTIFEKIISVSKSVVEWLNAITVPL